MNNEDALSLTGSVLAGYRPVPYGKLMALVGEPTIHIERTGDSGAQYQIDVKVIWDDKSSGTVRVRASIDDGGWRAFFPLGASFIKAPDGSFVDE